MYLKWYQNRGTAQSNVINKLYMASLKSSTLSNSVNVWAIEEEILRCFRSWIGIVIPGERTVEDSSKLKEPTYAKLLHWVVAGMVLFCCDEYSSLITGEKGDAGEREASADEEEEAEEEPPIFYDKAKSFFDSISCEALDKSRG